MKPLHTIDEVLQALQQIIDTSIKNKDPLGYFAVLYYKVTQKVKEGIQQEFFEDNPRMEQLDVIFASRYIDAYYAYQSNQPTTASWQYAFSLATQFWPTVFQHLLIGMNAHINLDLGIAAAEVSKGGDISSLKTDFERINQILSDLVYDVEEDLSKIWPTLKKILTLTKDVDNFLVDFSMKLARDGAWKFAETLFATAEDQKVNVINQRDIKIAKKAKIITEPGFIANFIMKIIRLGELGSVPQKIEDLKE
ncbi:DUF5995 family protein [Aquimarina brevivitae]|uniref:Uncharacterized protein n=1 Tax=Aquimarina brevivitae TaxID=323412 RepID=A0A4Q7P080_9FLAO|nr:DUF5995 family protein [Aquimarina brevivitae]RZS93186.1 hypothetical protein EV197_1757 [Aquimarina brevivitae]